jgi:hypothetical protein
VYAKRQQYGLLQPLVDSPLAGETSRFGNSQVTCFETVETIFHGLAQFCPHGGRRQFATLFPGRFN